MDTSSTYSAFNITKGICFETLIYGLYTMQRVSYAKTKSDAAAKLDGTWHQDKRTRKVTLASKEAEGSKPGEYILLYGIKNERYRSKIT